jgi:hypothetical protein
VIVWNVIWDAPSEVTPPVIDAMTAWSQASQLSTGAYSIHIRTARSSTQPGTVMGCTSSRARGGTSLSPRLQV